jgi:hypothetical protein
MILKEIIFNAYSFMNKQSTCNVFEPVVQWIGIVQMCTEIENKTHNYKEGIQIQC